VTASTPGPGPAGPERPEPGSPAGPEPGMPGIPADADRDEDVDVLALAGQIPSDDGEWLLVTSAEAAPGGEFLARHLRRDELQARGGDVVIRLAPDARPGLPGVRAQVWSVICGRLILAGTWDRQDMGRWPEQVRPAVTHAMGLLAELEDNGAWLGPAIRVHLDDPEAAMVGVPAGITAGGMAPAQPLP